MSFEADNDVVIKVDGLSKCYQVYEKPRDRLKQIFYPRLQGILGKEGKQYYKEFWALRDVSFSVRKGETVGIIGRNGSGKSTLLQMICGTLSPSDGSVKVNGRVAALLELGSGFNPEFTGRENVYLNASVLGLSKSEIDDRLDAIVAFADIGDFIDRPVKTYSSGMYVRLAFAVIAHVDADILVIDEALAVGDVFFTQKCMRFLRDFKRNGSILLVTHDTNSVVGMCDRAVWLNMSRMMMAGTAKEVCESYLEELYAASSSKVVTASSSAKHVVSRVENFRDVRQDYINSSNLRNDLEVFRFSDVGEMFGTGLVDVLDAYLAASDREAVSWFVGGEVVELHVVARAKVDLVSPIVGFLVKNKVGQNLFGENTFISCCGKSFVVRDGESFSAVFRFQMPIMPAGDYTVGVAVADGTQESHVIHRWVHDAIVFKSHSDSVSTGLLGIPMLKIDMGLYEQSV